MKSNFGVLLLLLLLSFVASEKEKELDLHFYQDDYQLKFERMELARFNKNLVKEASVVTFKFNRTTPLVNTTIVFNIDIGSELEAILQAYKFMSNEYRFFPIHFGANFCKALAADVAGISRFFKCGNFTGCRFVKGRKYHICNFTPDQSKLPPFIPSGDYKVEIQYLHFSKELFVTNTYFTISRPITYN